MKRSGRALIAMLLSAVVVLSMGACNSIPRSGPVTQSKGDSGTQVNNAAADLYPNPPRNRSSPEIIIEDFYNAGSRDADDYAVARLFLTQDASVDWNPGARTYVYRSAKVTKVSGENTYEYVLDLAFSIDQQGIVTQFAPGTERRVPVQLQKVDGEWRIDQAEDGTIIPEDVFRILYQAFPVYFYDPEFSYAVPDMRWFLNRSTVTKSIVSATLAGPAPYLKDAVVSAFPPDARLARESVPVVQGVAQIGMTEDLLNSSVTDRHRMLNQLNLSLRSQASIVSVQLRAGDTTLSMEDSDSVLPPVTDKPVPNFQVAVVQGQLSIFDNASNRADRIPGIDTTALNPRFPATALAAKKYAFLSSDLGTLFYITPGRGAMDILDRGRLTRPSFDPHGWLWTGNAGGVANEIFAFDTSSDQLTESGSRVRLSPSWLKGFTVKDVQASRDGTRLLVIAGKDKQNYVMVTGIVRGADGSPRSLTNPLVLSESNSADQGAWVNDSSVVVAQTGLTGQETPRLISLRNFQAQALPDVSGLLGISAGNGVQDIFTQTKAGIAVRIGNAWTLQGADVQDAKFPG